ncbi:MAG: MotA/TolQ/ExbB proton channel family protein [Candidatus Omnitrophica bacterium]|nr:MotA/TolQ/ExbB proton channel family protein [Candidatus Omnitrophota bacterium]
MFKGKSLWQIFQTGGITLYILLFCSVISIAIISQRIWYYWRRSKIKRVDFMGQIRHALGKGDIQEALRICRKTDTPFSAVVSAGLTLPGNTETAISHSMERQIAIETAKLERYTSIVGTIGSTAVYIGLFGTVLGIIRAFQDISASGSGGMNVVISGIAEALVCTAAGLLVAVPAVIAYNYFMRRIDAFVSDMELCASELLDLISARKRE